MNRVISWSDFVYNGSLFYRSFGCCYLLDEPARSTGCTAQKSLLVSKRISLDYYYQCLEACRQHIGGEVFV